ncbi:MAG: patatin-like phospholipase family protein, partial [Bacteroidota bacterium]
MNKTLILVLLSVFLFLNDTAAQRVGLVLSGGGAKGVAHIGVIKALEENHVPIDFITGTSMGAIVGGLYAAGYSPAEMDSLILSEEFLKWAKGEIEEEHVYYYMQDEPNASWFTLRIKYDSLVRKPVLPSSIVQPFQMDFAFIQIFTKATTACKEDFDSLFVPFRCVASDIENNQAVVLEKGNLGKSIRASMSYPFYFKPITIDGKVMLDGGMYNNFPSDVMLESFYPDMIIGSKVAGNYAVPDPTNIVSQLQTIMMRQTVYDVYCESSVMIEPEVPPVNVVDFSRRKEFIDSGYVAAKRKIDEIRIFLTDSVSPEVVSTRRKEFRKKMPPLVFNKININGLNANESSYINRMLLHNNDTTDIKSIKQDYFRILADDRIDYIYPAARYDEESGYYHLDLDVTKDNTIEVQFGGTVSSAPVNEAFLQAKYKYLGRQAYSIRLNSYIGRFYSSVSALGRMDFPGKTPFYIKGGIYYNQWDYFKTSTMFFEDKTPSYLIKNDFHNT